MSNLFNILEYEATRNIEKLRKPVEKEIWGIPPAQVNAFYNPNKNDIGIYIFRITQNITNVFAPPRALLTKLITTNISRNITHNIPHNEN